MASVKIEITEKELRDLIFDHLAEKFGHCSFNKSKVVIEVKSKQNYKSEWETAAFRAVYEGEV
jgi:RNase P/RNase MRP subunit POP5